MSNRSSTVTIELRDNPIHNIDRLSSPASQTISNEPTPFHQGRTLSRPSPRGSQNEPHGPNDRVSPLPVPTTASQPAERWNHPRSNISRVLAAFWSLLVMGMNDAAYGAIIPYMGPYYRLSYTVVSLIFLSPFVGYSLAAFINNSIHQRFGQRGIAILCSGCHLVAYIIVSLHPPYAVLVVVYMLAGFGNGIGDGAWNAWIGAMDNPNEVLGMLHACYGAGGVLAPLIATSMITKAKVEWYAFYYVMVGAAAIEMVATVSMFWTKTGKVFRDAHPNTTGSPENSRMREALLQMPAARITWLCAAFLLCYLGVGVSLGGWIVQFMIDVRNGGAFASGMVATGFWLGLTVGRAVLGFITPRIGDRLALMVSAALWIQHEHHSDSEISFTDIYPSSHGPRAFVLARSTVLRLCRRRRPPGLLLRASFPSRRGRRYKITAETPSRQHYRLRYCLWGKWCSHPAVRCRCHRPVQGRWRSTAHHLGASGSAAYSMAGTVQFE